MDDSMNIVTQGLNGFKSLSQSNYIEWRDIIDDYLDSQNWIKYSNEGLSTDASEELREKSAKIAVSLKTAAGNQRTYLLGLRTPKDILAKLEEIKGGASRGTLSSLQHQFSSPDENEKVDNVAALLSQLQAQIGGISSEDRPTELSKKDVLLRCYQNKYRVTVETLRIVASDYSFAQIVERLRQAEFEAKETPVEVALRAEGNGINKPGKRENRKCYYCGKIGHIKPDCKKRKSDDKKKQRGNQKERYENAGVAWMVSKETEIGPDDWCVDSGATSHMTNDRSIFIEYEDFKSTVGTAKTDVNLNVVGRGKICCKINGQNTVFEGVLHIPELHSNLLSPGKLTRSGLKVSLGAKDVTISRDKRVVAKGQKIGDTWVLRAHQAKEIARRVDSDASNMVLLWHRRLGHPGREKMSLISQAVEGIPNLRVKNSLECNTCSLTKSIRSQSRKAPLNPATKRLERTFIDTWGPYKYPSIGGKRYMLVIVDEYSRMSWVYFMARKSDVLNIIPEWKHQVELESGEKVINVRSDGAPELREAVRKIGAIHESTTANTPEQNGKVERMNRTIVTKARSMLAGPGLPKRLWAEAMSTACYLRNITPSVEKTKTPFEIWTGHRPTVEHLKVFGCVAYAHIDKNKRDKLDLNAKKGIFVGYRRTSKQYRIMNPITGKIIESSHVTFKEDQKGGSLIKCTDSPRICEPTDIIPCQVFDEEQAEDQEEHYDLPNIDPNTSVLEKIVNCSNNLLPQEQVNTEALNSKTGRPQRERRPPNRLIEELGRENNPNDHAAVAILSQEKSSEFTPQCYTEAMKHRNWREAIETTLESLSANNTWKFVNKPENVNLVSTKWIFKLKKPPNNQIDKYKARLIARSFTQRKGVDLFEMFSGVVRSVL